MTLAISQNESVALLTEDRVRSMEAFNQKLNTEPQKNEVQVNKMAGNSNYLPISFVQTKLDEIFLGMWSFEMDHVQVIANEVIGYGVLTVVNPITGMTIKRSGSAAVMIQQTKDSALTDYNNKIKNTLVKDFPHLQAECMKSAAKTLGKIFGRDLNRKFSDDYTPEYSPEIDREKISDDAKETIRKAQTLEDLSILWDSLEESEKANPELVKLMKSRKAEIKAMGGRK